MSCHLRATQVTLLDGNAYTFRTLPLNRSTMRMVSQIDSDPGQLLELVGKSLSYDQTPEQIEAVIGEEAALIPMDYASPILKNIMVAMGLPEQKAGK